MSKPRIVADPKSRFTSERVAENNKSVRASATPEMGVLMDEVQAAFDAENADFNARLDGETKLRAWAKELVGFSISMTEIEDLQDRLNGVKNGQSFSFKGVTLIKTNMNTVDRLDRYLFVLERTIIGATPLTTDVNGHLLVKYKFEFPNLSFFGLIKLAFQRLFIRSK